MSGDLGAEVVVRAAAASLEKHTDLELVLVGDQDELTGLVTKIIGDESRLRIVHATQVVKMSDAPRDAIRHKKDSSMRVAIDLVKSEDAAACVSAGNTGALMATAKFVLKMLPGIDRPAIIAGRIADAIGGSIVYVGSRCEHSGCSADHLLQFAIMGSDRCRPTCSDIDNASRRCASERRRRRGHQGYTRSVKRSR